MSLVGPLGEKIETNNSFARGRFVKIRPSYRDALYPDVEAAKGTLEVTDATTWLNTSYVRVQIEKDSAWLAVKHTTPVLQRGDKVFFTQRYLNGLLPHARVKLDGIQVISELSDDTVKLIGHPFQFNIDDLVSVDVSSAHNIYNVNDMVNFTVPNKDDTFSATVMAVVKDEVRVGLDGCSSYVSASHVEMAHPRFEEELKSIYPGRRATLKKGDQRVVGINSHERCVSWMFDEQWTVAGDEGRQRIRPIILVNDAIPFPIAVSPNMIPIVAGSPKVKGTVPCGA